MFRRPLHYVRKYVREVEQNLGATDRPFKLSEAGKKVSWGKQKSLQRVHYLLSEILETLLRGKTEKACLMTVLSLRAVHQAAIDQDWAVAWMITHQDDPFTRPRWGGDVSELANVTAYLRSMAELEKSTEKLRYQHGGTADQPSPNLDNYGKKKKKGKGKGKQGEKDEEATEKA